MEQPQNPIPANQPPAGQAGPDPNWVAYPPPASPDPNWGTYPGWDAYPPQGPCPPVPPPYPPAPYGAPVPGWEPYGPVCPPQGFYPPTPVYPGPAPDPAHPFYLRKQHKKLLGRPASMLLLYFLVMNLATFLLMLFQALAASFQGKNPDPSALLSTMGYGYLLSTALGLIVLWVWKRAPFFRFVAFRRNAPMRPVTLVTLICLGPACQLLFSVVAVVLELLFRLFGFTLTSALENATGTGMDSLTMFLYIAFLGPITEELWFRGAILRTFQPFGRKLAVLLSALLFGLFHGNLPQGIFAFAFGLILGYTAMEYSIFWSIFLHIFNNLVLNYGMRYLTGLVPPAYQTAVQLGILVLLALIGIVLCLVRRRKLSAWCSGSPIDRAYTKLFWTNPWNILLIVAMALVSLTTISPLSK